MVAPASEAEMPGSKLDLQLNTQLELDFPPQKPVPNTIPTTPNPTCRRHGHIIWHHHRRDSLAAAPGAGLLLPLQPLHRCRPGTRVHSGREHGPAILARLRRALGAAGAGGCPVSVYRRVRPHEFDHARGRGSLVPLGHTGTRSLLLRNLWRRLLVPLFGQLAALCRRQRPWPHGASERPCPQSQLRPGHVGRRGLQEPCAV